MAAAARLETRPIAAERELAAFMSGRTGEGAVVSFAGLARDTASDGMAVERLCLDWYPGLTEASLQTIANDGANRFEIADLLVIHRCGDIAPGETVVLVAVAARSRRAAFQCADYVMDRLKTEAAFWKREEGPAGARWVEPTENDRADRARWDETDGRT